MAGVGDSRAHQMFLVDGSAKLGELRWITPGPRVNVVIESQLTIHPDLAEWVAVVQYEVAAGALESIHLKVPTAWAARAQVERGDDGLKSQGGIREVPPPSGISPPIARSGGRVGWSCGRPCPSPPARKCSIPRSPRWGSESPTRTLGS